MHVSKNIYMYTYAEDYRIIFIYCFTQFSLFLTCQYSVTFHLDSKGFWTVPGSFSAVEDLW